jgi:cyanophycinase-like exopeptidase
VSETIAVGSAATLRDVLASGEPFRVTSESDVVIVPTAAAFTGATQSAIELSLLLEESDAKVEALMNIDRTSSDEEYFAQRVREADLVVLSDGSPLHAKSVWHATSLGEAIRDATRVIAIGSVASVLGDVMIDPRGGAPTTGLGYRSGLVLSVSASEEQLHRTRSLLGADALLAVLGEHGAVYSDGEGWKVLRDDVVVTREHEVVTL